MGRAARRRWHAARSASKYVTGAGLLEKLARHADADLPPAPRLPLPFKTRDLRPARGAFAVVRLAGKGAGAVATRDLAPGTTLVCERALAMVLDREVDAAADEDEDDDERATSDEAADGGAAGVDGALLILRLCGLLVARPAFERSLSRLFPRTASDAAGLRRWKCASPALDALVRVALATLPNDLGARLPHVVRYNAVDVHSGGERLSYPTLPEAALSGVALFARGSCFNHPSSAPPNVQRWHVGDVACFRTSAVVRAGDELTMAYCDAALLSDGDAEATALGHFDFGRIPREAARPLLDACEQTEIMAMPRAADRLNALAPFEGAPLAADRLNRAILFALTLGADGAAKEAADAWLDCLALADALLPPNDESLVALRTAAAKAALAAGRAEDAAVFFRAARAAHGVCFGAGTRLFRLRYGADVALPACPGADGSPLWATLE